MATGGGFGFIGAGTDTSALSSDLANATKLLKTSEIETTNDVIPIAIPLIAKYKPAATWFFAPSSVSSLYEWTTGTRKASPYTKIWVQIGSVKEAVQVVQAAKPDVLVQGTDAGGHGLVQGASLIALMPEVSDKLNRFCEEENIPTPVLIAAGGVVEARGAAAAFALGASGVVLGTRLLASPEANISTGYQDEILRASDGGQSTVRTKVYDNLRETTGWVETHNTRGMINRSYSDAIARMDQGENKKLYEEEMSKGDAGWGVEARMTTYAGSGVGLVTEVKPVSEIIQEIREDSRAVLERSGAGAIAGKL